MVTGFICLWFGVFTIKRFFEEVPIRLFPFVEIMLDDVDKYFADLFKGYT